MLTRWRSPALSLLSLETASFLNPLAGGQFSLRGGNGGNSLFLVFTSADDLAQAANPAVPEPASLALLALGLLLLRRRAARTR